MYLNRLISRIYDGMIKVITGIRGCGKRTLLFDLFYQYLISLDIPADHIITLSLDDIENRKYRDPEVLYQFLKDQIKDQNDHYYVFLDEIQFAISRKELRQDSDVALYGVLNSLLKRRNVDVYVTGSNSKLLSKDVLTEFRGRGDEIRVLPLSFSEFFSAYEGTKEDAWQNYLMFGGMPHILFLRTEEQKYQYLNSLNQEIYLKDISERYEISRSSQMEELMKVIASSVGSLTNPQKIADTFRSSGIKGISSPTIKEYLSYLQDSGLINKAERYDVKGRKSISTPSKYYYSDLGLRNSLLGFRQFEETHLMENAIYNELLYRGFLVDVGVVPVSFKENGVSHRKQLEIDFIANQGNRRYYIQSADAIPDQQKMHQEQESLIRVPDSFKKIIVTNTSQPLWRNEQGITIMSIYDFLLNPDSLDL